MNIRICKKCGWKFPETQPGIACTWCKTEFDERYCVKCNTLKPKSEFETTYNMCNACRGTVIRARYREQCDMQATVTKELLDGWIASTKLHKHKLLTEQDWLAACRHFNGCAFCGEESIDARVFFIPFKFGGRYTKDNVVPACDKCATSLKRLKNPFRLFAEKLIDGTSYKVGFVPEKMQLLQDYLRKQMGDDA